MNEQLLQYIWQFQYFNKSELQTTEGEVLEIIQPGKINLNQGPDFINAKIKIGNTVWAGNVELHLKSSDWDRHKHANDKNYKNVIFHVVYEQDAVVNHIPVLALKSRISKSLLSRYKDLMQSQSFILCEGMIKNVSEITIVSWKERLITERLSRKTEVVFAYLEENNFHWEETFWWMLAKNFGTKVNAEAFEAIAQSVSINILAKHKNQIHQLEALLLGQAGLLEQEFEEDYAIMLQKEYRFLSSKYKLQPIRQPVHFLRMRPFNFPTVRLAQLAALIQTSTHLFSKTLEEASLQKVKELFKVEANDFWNYHYRLESESKLKQKAIGENMIDNILINTIFPMLFAYGMYHQKQSIKDKVLKWIEEVKAEKNTITNKFEALGIKNNHALDSQALIELKNQYCNHRRCLQCAIGNKLLGYADK